MTRRPPNLGVLVPCRDEARVIERKLENLASLAWPEGRHQLVVVDDGSSDGTAERARAAWAALAERAPAAVDFRVVANASRPGKPGAIAAGLAALGGAIDLAVLTDADVVLAKRALAELALAFEEDAELAMACGAQRFVEAGALATLARGEDAAEARLASAAGIYDRWTAAVRRLESRGGRLFSVHGQLLAWRADLGLAPTPGLAADDLDLMLQVRARREPPRAVRLVPGALFVEEKEPQAAREAQALRRARAYVQAMARRRPSSGRRVDRLQLAGYRALPLAAPWLAASAALALPLAALFARGPRAAGLALAVLAALAALAPVRRLARLLSWIARAEWAELRGDLGDRWDMARRPESARPGRAPRP